MTGAIRLCTDSSAQLPAAVVAALDLDVVSVGISLDGVPYDENDLDVDLFYARLCAGSQVTTSQPSPGGFADAYAAAAARGASEVLSIHVGREVSGTVGSAELAAREALLPVTVVDTRVASFGVGVCVMAAAEVVAAGASAEQAVGLIEQLAPTLRNVFIAPGAPGGRVPSTEGLTVFSFADGRTEIHGPADSPEGAAELMAQHVLSDGGHVRTAVGHAGSSTAQPADLLAGALQRSPRVSEVIRYRIGPSVGAHTGPLSFGAFWWPVGDAGSGGRPPSTPGLYDTHG